MKALGMLSRMACRQLQVQARRNGHGHAPHNPGMIFGHFLLFEFMWSHIFEIEYELLR